MSVKLYDNDRKQIDFANNPDYEIEVSFTRWTNGVSPIIKQTFDFIEGNPSKNFEMIKAIHCNPASQETDSSIDKHLVLFIKEVSSPASDQLLETLSIPMSTNEKTRMVTVRYFITDTNIPSANQITCDFYHSLINDLLSLTEDDKDAIVPDTNNGSIIIKRQR
jgi:hypothetical protein